MNVGELSPTHKTVFVLHFKGKNMMFYPRPCTTPVARAVDGLASKLHPGGRGETRLGSTSGSL